MDDIIVFVARRAAPADDVASAVEREANASAGPGEELEIGVDVAEELGAVFEPGELAYVESVLGPYRIDVLTYRGTPAVAAALERLYASVPALVDADSDAIFTVPELVALLRRRSAPVFHAWADPAKREAE